MSTSFNWYDRREFAGIPKNELLRVVAKTTTSTDHTRDSTIPVEERKIRIYSAEELMLAARSLIQRKVLINHKQDVGWVLDSEYNPILEQVEAILQVPSNYVEAYNQNKFSTCSVGINARSEVVSGNTTTYHGLWFDEVSLVIPDEFNKVAAGDPRALVSAFETKMEFIGIVESVPIEEAIKIVEMVVKRGNQFCVIHCHGPDAGKAIKCFDNKDAAMAMHYAIMARKKKESIETPKPVEIPKPVEPIKPVETPKEPVKPIETPKPIEIPKEPIKPIEIPKLPEIHNPSIIPQKPIEEPKKVVKDEPVTDAEIEEFTKKVREYPELLRKVTDLETTVNTAQVLIKEFKMKQDEEIKKAVIAEKERVIKKIEEAIPSVLIQRQSSISFNRLVIEIKKKILELA